MDPFIRFFRLLVMRFIADSVSTRAASLAFTTLLSIVPLAMFIFYLLSFFPVLSHPGAEMEQLIITHLVPNSASMVIQQLNIFVANVKDLSWLNIISLAIIAGLLVFNIITTVNVMWQVKMTELSTLSLLVYWMILGILPVIFAFILFFSSYLKTLSFFSVLSPFDFFVHVFYIFSPWLLEWITFSLFHYLIPSCYVRWRYAFIGGLITTVAFELAKFGFVAYLRYFPTYQLFYGALAVIPIFFVWVFLVWMIIITAALICHLLQKTCG